MKIAIIACLALAGCASNLPAPSLVPEPTATVESKVFVYCKPQGDPFLNGVAYNRDCFDSAYAWCSTVQQTYPSQAHWHAVAEEGMTFPAIVADEHGFFRMRIACQ